VGDVAAHRLPALCVGVTPLLGKFGDQYGKERLLLISLAIFFAGSAAAIFAPNIWITRSSRMSSRPRRSASPSVSSRRYSVWAAASASCFKG
jgi:MFS family permease